MSVCELAVLGGLCQGLAHPSHSVGTFDTRGFHFDEVSRTFSPFWCHKKIIANSDILCFL